MRNKKVLVLGSDFGSLGIVKKAQRMGFHVVVADYLESTLAKEAADEAWLVSTNETDKLAEMCNDGSFCGILTGVSDFNGTCARELSRSTGLPFYTGDDYAWRVARDKSEFRRVCERVGAPVAKGYRLTPELRREDLDVVEYPVVVKPVDMSANRGMSYCANERELVVAYEKARAASVSGKVVCERQLHGGEWVANYILAGGEARLLYFGRELHQPGEAANLYSFINTTANGLKLWLEEANEKVKAVFREARFEDGIAWVEAMLDEDGHFYLIEPGYRFSSESSYGLYSRVDGFDSMKWYIDSCTGVSHDASEMPPDLDAAYKACVGSYHLFSKKGGVIGSISGADEVASIEGVEVDITKRPGATLPAGGNLGLVRIYGANVDELCAKLRKVNETLSIRSSEGENMFIRFTDYDGVKDDFARGLRDYGVETA